MAFSSARQRPTGDRQSVVRQASQSPSAPMATKSVDVSAHQSVHALAWTRPATGRAARRGPTMNAKEWTARCDTCDGPAVSDCCGLGEVVVVETPHGTEVVCSACFSPVECCMEPGCQ